MLGSKEYLQSPARSTRSRVKLEKVRIQDLLLVNASPTPRRRIGLKKPRPDIPLPPPEPSDDENDESPSTSPIRACAHRKAATFARQLSKLEEEDKQLKVVEQVKEAENDSRNSLTRTALLERTNSQVGNAQGSGLLNVEDNNTPAESVPDSTVSAATPMKEAPFELPIVHDEEDKENSGKTAVLTARAGERKPLGELPLLEFGGQPLPTEQLSHKNSDEVDSVKKLKRKLFHPPEAPATPETC
ncbi:hypothetical protein BC832DRAFT_346623 [Gaertneriomyces semiglobifer]|nr:hypothetical protein BC832DRAFT_346623 [Gaertneriomyces semiglobifer]